MQKRVKKRILPLVLALMLVAFISEAQVFAAVDITTFKAGLLAPRGMTVDDDGNVYVVELDRNQINKFDSDGTLLKTWGGEGSGDGKFKSPYGIALDSSGNIYVTDTGNKRIQKFDFNGDFITKWSGGADYYFESPAAIAVDSDNKVYVADCFSKLIQKFDSDGGFIKSWGGLEKTKVSLKIQLAWLWTAIITYMSQIAITIEYRNLILMVILLKVGRAMETAITSSILQRKLLWT